MMTRNFIINIAKSCLMICLPILFFSCNNWRDSDSVDIKTPSVSGKVKEAYYRALREYKQTKHDLTYMGFDNSAEVAQSNGQLLEFVPDSVDVVILSHPKKLSIKVENDMQRLKKERAYDFAYEIDIHGINLVYEEMLLASESEEEEGNESEAIVDLPTFMKDSIKTCISWAEPFDGIILKYIGKDVNYLSPEELQVYTDTENAIIDAMTNWMKDNPSKFLTIQGYPQNFSNKALLSPARNIIVETAPAADKEKVKLILLNAADGVPTDKFILSVNAVSLAEEETDIGYWVDESGNYTSPAIHKMAELVASTEMPFVLQGLSINHGSNDYYNVFKRYLNVRTGIQIMNPSLIN